jgi:hypothetical protein
MYLHKSQMEKSRIGYTQIVVNQIMGVHVLTVDESRIYVKFQRRCYYLNVEVEEGLML